MKRRVTSGGTKRYHVCLVSSFQTEKEKEKKSEKKGEKYDFAWPVRRKNEHLAFISVIVPNEILIQQRDQP